MAPEPQPNHIPIPGVAEIERIAAIPDPPLRNLQITQCYHELSAALARRTGPGANWCTFAAWASRQAGQTIRKEDLARLVDRRLQAAPLTPADAARLQFLTRFAPGRPGPSLHDLAVTASRLSRSIELASDAVGRGNLKVFAEIGREFARFFAACLDDPAPDPASIAAFCQELRPGDPPEGQGRLQAAFTHYYQALFTASPKARAELLLLANIQIGFHEQTRLQPEIAESLDAGMIKSVELTRQVIRTLYPNSSLVPTARLYLMRLLGRPTALDLAIRALHTLTSRQLRQALTEVMMTLTLPGGVQLRLGEDLKMPFPPALQKLENAELLALLRQVDPTPDSAAGSGARDWASLPDRLHFIVDLFRSYHAEASLFQAPFDPEQTAVLKAGRLPGGVL